eukprot:CAMPEP_0119012484 /NCGR_PEP_ID=MMETSP1176-20130426/6778_1 /TAXON_ID=265551 /ORGANISM="Synedropsis recta cf, Strain CCMP1620" /LENGTH=238 /DNA_ID=CAMNT_0006965451 /DNA_START=160 /DNA_END=876 /DNA_ORIENTATION=+
MSIWALIFSIIAYCFAINASYGCFYVTAKLPDDTAIGIINEGTLGFGLFSYSNPLNSFSEDVGYSCIVYNYDIADYFFDAPFKTARAFGIMGNISIGIPMIAAILLSCMTLSKGLLKLFTYMLFFGSFCELMTFIVFASEICTNYQCQFSVGAGLAIGGSIAAFITGWIFLKIPGVNEDDIFPGAMTAGGVVSQPAGTVTVQETVEPDGTKKIVKTTVNADGSQTVEETIEKPQAQAY